jgi:hypothetical protein
MKELEIMYKELGSTYLWLFSIRKLPSGEWVSNFRNKFYIL